MLEEIEQLNRHVEIVYDTRVWSITTRINGHIENAMGRTIEDALDALKLRLKKYES